MSDSGIFFLYSSLDVPVMQKLPFHYLCRAPDGSEPQLLACLAPSGVAAQGSVLPASAAAPGSACDPVPSETLVNCLACRAHTAYWKPGVPAGILPPEVPRGKSD